jgi:hypothetical protein
MAKPYIVLLTNGTSSTKRKKHTLNSREWDVIERIFREHPELVQVVCVDGDT